MEFGTKIEELQRTVELDGQDVALLDSVGFTTAYDTRNDKAALVAREHDDVIHCTEQFAVVKYVGDSYVAGSEIPVGDN